VSGPEAAKLAPIDEAFHAALRELDDYLEHADDERRAELCLPLASRLALHEAGLDLTRLRAEAEAFVQATPLSDRVLSGYAEQAAWWLGQRMLLDAEDNPLPAEQVQATLDAARAAIATRADQIEAAGFPRVAAGFRSVLSGTDDDALREALALRIVETVT